MLICNLDFVQYKCEVTTTATWRYFDSKKGNKCIKGLVHYHSGTTKTILFQ